MNERNCSFGQAKDYFKDMVGMSKDYSLSIIRDLDLDKFYKSEVGSKKNIVKHAKIKRAKELYLKALKFEKEDLPFKRYLAEHRGIQTIVSNYKVSLDLAMHQVWSKQKREYIPALITFARDKDKQITGGQTIYLDKDTGNKVAKRSLRKISGSFVEIQPKGDGINESMTIIAEGVETALSIQEVGIKGRILCSLGVSNIKNRQGR